MATKLPLTLEHFLKPFLNEGEVIRCVFKESFRLGIDFRWLVLTNFRLLVLKRTTGAFSVKEFHLKEMDIELRSGFFLYDVIEFKSKEKVLYETQVYKVRRKEAEEFVRDAVKVIGERDNAAPGAATGKTCEPMQNLKDLVELREKGAITPKEFVEKKKKLLKKI